MKVFVGLHWVLEQHSSTLVVVFLMLMETTLPLLLSPVGQYCISRSNSVQTELFNHPTVS